VGWETEFKCAGVENLADFQVFIDELDSADPGSHLFRCPVNIDGQGSVESHLNFDVRDFARRMNAVLDLLDCTADALAATWDLQADEMVAEIWDGDLDVEPTIQ